MLRRPPKTELRRLRQTRWRDRARRDVLVVSGEVPRRVVEALVDLKWLAPDEAADRRAIMAAMVAAQQIKATRLPRGRRGRVVRHEPATNRNSASPPPTEARPTLSACAPPLPYGSRRVGKSKTLRRVWVMGMEIG